ncbi:MAG: hypothetical protein KY476_19640 [Planctomycetes bacterium]|nr:hypothetical protein [Planctomycetota bacterium]
MLLQIGDGLRAIAAERRHDHVAGPDVREDVEEDRRFIDAAVQIDPEPRQRLFAAFFATLGGEFIGAFRCKTAQHQL